MNQIPCERCQAQFAPRGRRRFCYDCRPAGPSRARWIRGTCASCGAAFEQFNQGGRPRQYCSRDCNRNCDRPRVAVERTRPCDRCSSLVVLGSRDRTKRVFCSQECRLTAALMPAEARPCRWCSAPIQLGAGRGNARRYCDDHCYRLASRRIPITYIRACRRCGDTFRSSQPQQLYCSPDCQRRHGIASRRRAVVRLGSATRRAVHQRDNWTCYLCGSGVDPTLRWPHPRAATVDHVIPVSAGGTNQRDNLRSAHWGCNEAKGDKLPDEMPAGFGGWANTKGAE